MLDRISDSSTETIYSPDFVDMARFFAQKANFPPSQISGELFPASDSDNSIVPRDFVELKNLTSSVLGIFRALIGMMHTVYLSYSGSVGITETILIHL